jgi:hypothetical protein
VAIDPSLEIRRRSLAMCAPGVDSGLSREEAIERIDRQHETLGEVRDLRADAAAALGRHPSGGGSRSPVSIAARERERPPARLRGGP